MIRLTLRLPEELHQQIEDRASLDHRSTNSEILHLLDAALNVPTDEIARWSRRERD